MRTEPETVAIAGTLRSRGESGSAYLVVLMLLVVLTIIGLSLSVVTQTEVIIGGSEKQSTRQLFAASSAIHMQVAYEMVGRATKQELTLATREETLFGQQVEITDTLCTTAFVPVAISVCNLCMMNQDAEYKAVQYAVTATTLRHGETDFAARREVGGAIALEPWIPTNDGTKNSEQEDLWDEGDSMGSGSLPPFDPDDPCRDVRLKI
jgi:hypothetical protein